MASGAEIDLVLRYVGEITNLSGFTKHKLPLHFASIRRIPSWSRPTYRESIYVVSFFRKTLVLIRENACSN